MSKVDELVPPSLAFTSPPRRIHFSTQISNLLSSVQMALFCGSSGGMSIAIARAHPSSEEQTRRIFAHEELPGTQRVDGFERTREVVALLADVFTPHKGLKPEQDGGFARACCVLRGTASAIVLNTRSGKGQSHFNSIKARLSCLP
jgi:hypothetical protein